MTVNRKLISGVVYALSAVFGFFSGVIFNFDDSASKVVSEISSLGSKKREIKELKTSNRDLRGENLRLRQLIEAEDANFTIYGTTLAAFGVSGDTYFVSCNNRYNLHPVLTIENILGVSSKPLAANLLTSFAAQESINLEVNKYTKKVYGLSNSSTRRARGSCDDLNTESENDVYYFIKNHNYIGPFEQSEINFTQLNTLHKFVIKMPEEKNLRLFLDQRSDSFKNIYAVLLTTRAMDTPIYLKYENLGGVNTITGIMTISNY